MNEQYVRFCMVCGQGYTQAQLNRGEHLQCACTACHECKQLHGEHLDACPYSSCTYSNE